MNDREHFTRVGFRAIDDEEDDEYNTKTAVYKSNCASTICKTCLRWSPKIRREMVCALSKKLACKLLLVVYSKPSSIFAECCVLQQTNDWIGLIHAGMSSRVSSPLQSENQPDDSIYIFRLRRFSDVLVCHFKQDIKPEQSFSLTTQLMTALDSVHLKVVILSELNIANYRTDLPTDVLDPPFLRCLVTDSFAHNVGCPYLEPPNTVSGLSAQILTYCQLNRIPACLYLCITDLLATDIVAAKKLCDTLHPLSFMMGIVQKNRQTGEKMKQFAINSKDDLNTFI